MVLENIPLIPRATYDSKYDASLLFPVPRSYKREEIGVDTNNPPFKGIDYWTAYEVSWLNPKNKPEVRILDLRYSALTPNIVESKSLKLYLNSFNDTNFSSDDEVQTLITKDLEAIIGGKVHIKLMKLDDEFSFGKPTGICLDDQDITIDPAQRQQTISTTTEHSQEKLYSNLLKSNCLITGQPDWGTIEITYKGNKINHEELLRYLLSFRQHNEFIEQFAERIFNDLNNMCNPQELVVYCRYTRRGGIDGNPLRYSKHMTDIDIENQRYVRQ